MTSRRRVTTVPTARTVTTGAFRIASAIALVTTSPIGCGQATSPIVIAGVTPARAYGDRPVVLRIDAGSVRPALLVDVATGGLVADVASLRVMLLSESDGALPSVRLETLEWDGVDFSLWARTPSDLAAGLYGLEVVDQHGLSARLAGAFEGLGPDPAPPTIELPSLAAGPYVRAGSEARIEIVADDGLGAVEAISWSTSEGDAGACPPPQPGGAPDIRDRPSSPLKCVASFTAPALDETQPALVPFSLLVTAQDTSGQQAMLDTALFRAKPPEIDSFSETVGSLGGYQPFVVRGRHFLPGSRALIGGVPIAAMSPGGELQDDHALFGWTPPHGRAEPVAVEVHSPVGLALAAAKFTYVSAPKLRDVQPPVGPALGGIRVTVRGNDLRTGVVVYVGATRDARQPLYNVTTYDTQNRVVGCLPSGTGTVSLWAYDPITGDSELPLAFSYQDGGVAPPADPMCQIPAK